MPTTMDTKGANISTEALDALYRGYAPAAFRRARRLLGQDADAHEVVHDVFLSLLERPDGFRAGGALSSYLYGAVTHACLNRIRNRSTRMRLLKERFFGKSEVDHGQTDPESATVLRSMLERMPAPLAEVAVYHFMDGLTHAEIAAIVGCSRRQVGNHVMRLADWAGKQEPMPCKT